MIKTQKRDINKGNLFVDYKNKMSQILVKFDVIYNIISKKVKYLMMIYLNK